MITFFPGQRVRILRLAVFKFAQPAVEVRFKDFLDLLWESLPQTPAWRVCAALAALEDGQQFLRFRQHKCINETKQGERGRARARDEHLYCVSSRVLRSHVISISKKGSGQFRQQVVGKVRIVNPTLEKKIKKSSTIHVQWGSFYRDD